MSGGTRRPLLCWDSCLFLAWFNKEEDKPLAEIERTLRSIERESTILLVSVISYAEILDRSGASDAGTQFRGFVKRQNVIVANVDPRIASTAAELRIHVRAARERGEIDQGIKIPDSLIAATAMLYRADELHTFDPVLLWLNRTVAVAGLPVIVPDDAGRTPLGF